MGAKIAYTCDGCGLTEQFEPNCDLPPGWKRLMWRTESGWTGVKYKNVRHFCSLCCLVGWARKVVAVIGEADREQFYDGPSPY